MDIGLRCPQDQGFGSYRDPPSLPHKGLKSMPGPSIFCFILSAFTALVAQEPSLERLREEGRWKQLRPRIEALYQANPEDPHALLWMSRVKQAFGEPQAAYELARKAVALKSTDPELQTQLGLTVNGVINETAKKGIMGNMLKLASLAKEWKKALYTALDLNPASGEASDSQLTLVAAEPWHEEAIESLISFYLGAPGPWGSRSKAKELAGRITKIEPATGLVFQAKVAFDEKDSEKAKSLLQQALAIDPACRKAHRLLVQSLWYQKPEPLDTIITHCRKAVESHPEAIEFHYNLAFALAEQGKGAELDLCLAEARRVCPDDLSPYFYAAKNLLKSNKPDKVEPYLQIYLAQDPEGFAPDRANAHVLLGQVYEKQGHLPEAIKAFEQALRLRPNYHYAQKELKRIKKG